MLFLKSVKHLSKNSQRYQYSQMVKNKATTVRIWKSGYFDEEGKFVHTNILTSLRIAKNASGESNIGHVSVETEEIYASLWPRQLTITNKLKSQEYDGREITPNDDILAEKREPDVTIKFLTLDTQVIKKELELFQKIGRYHLMGRYRLFNLFNPGGTNNCSGLAYDLLISAGIKKLLPTSYLNYTDYIVITPNKLADIVVLAKKQEETILDNKVSKKDDEIETKQYKY